MPLACESLERVWILCPEQWGVCGAGQCPLRFVFQQDHCHGSVAPLRREAKLQDQRLRDWVRGVIVQKTLSTRRAGTGFGTSRTSFDPCPFSYPYCSLSPCIIEFSDFISMSSEAFVTLEQGAPTPLNTKTLY